MNVRTLSILFLGLSLLSACKGGDKPSAVFDNERESQSAEQKPHAHLSISENIDLGVFTADNLKKEATILITNTGNDTLYILSAQPECDCTTAEVLDSVVAPLKSGRLAVTLDLSDYPNDTIYKTVGIISNSVPDRVVRFNLVGVRK